MFKTKRIAAVLVMIAVLSALALSGCMPAATGGEGGSEGASTSSNLMSFLPLILIVVVFYFILIRPQNKKNKQVNEMRNALKRGDYVTTIGGFRGRVVRVKDDLVTIEIGSDKNRLDIMRWGISKIDEAAPESKSSKDKDDDDAMDEEQPKRKPRKLAPAVKKEPEVAEDTESEEILEEVSEDEEDEKK